VFPNLTNH